MTCVAFDVAAEGFPRVDGMNGQATAGEFAMRLNQQVDPVDNKIELGDDLLFLEVIGQKADVVIGQRGFAAALRMPDNAFSDAVVEFVLNGFGGEQLRVTHDMLLQAVRFVYIGHGILQDESQPIAAKQ